MPISGCSPLTSSAKRVIRPRGTSKETTEGRKMSLIVAAEEIWPLIQSMVVVTSPMGVHAPPALAAMTTTAPKNWRCLGSLMSFRSREIMTMVEVRLSRMEDMKNVIHPTIHSSLVVSFVLIASVTILNPLCESTVSTIAIAPIKKNTIWPTSASCSFSARFTACPSGFETARIVHRAAAISSATPDLLNATVSSKMIPAYPRVKTINIESCSCCSTQSRSRTKAASRIAPPTPNARKKSCLDSYSDNSQASSPSGSHSSSGSNEHISSQAPLSLSSRDSFSVFRVESFSSAPLTFTNVPRFTPSRNFNPRTPAMWESPLNPMRPAGMYARREVVTDAIFVAAVLTVRGGTAAHRFVGRAIPLPEDATHTISGFRMCDVGNQRMEK
mmetsp:Transcript_25197/g.42203  ORF Transcript_25197/g.42203 Transcript_25197/m.42203 type:complete len:386 (+) Transcript_25197:1148-2305(+)